MQLADYLELLQAFEIKRCVQEAAEETAIPRATIYRRLREFRKLGLIRQAGFILRRRKRHSLWIVTERGRSVLVSIFETISVRHK